MAATQLWLFPPPRTFVGFFGERLSYELPTQSGRLFFCRIYSDVIHDGGAKNSRKPSGCYRIANSEHPPRRLSLAARVGNRLRTREVETLLRKEELVRTLNPKSNCMGTSWPGVAPYLTLHRAGAFQLRQS